MATNASNGYNENLTTQPALGELYQIVEELLDTFLPFENPTSQFTLLLETEPPDPEAPNFTEKVIAGASYKQRFILLVAKLRGKYSQKIKSEMLSTARDIHSEWQTKLIDFIVKNKVDDLFLEDPDIARLCWSHWNKIERLTPVARSSANAVAVTVLMSLILKIIAYHTKGMGLKSLMNEVINKYWYHTGKNPDPRELATIRLLSGSRR